MPDTSGWWNSRRRCKPGWKETLVLRRTGRRLVVWGIACWIGGGFCSGKGPWQAVVGDDAALASWSTWGLGPGVNRQRVDWGMRARGRSPAGPPAGCGPRGQTPLVDLGDAARGVNRQLVHLRDAGRGVNRSWSTWSVRAKAMPVRANAACWPGWKLWRRGKRGCGAAAGTGAGLRAVANGQPGNDAVFLDPPYSFEAGRDNTCYRVESGTVADDCREWAIEHGSDPMMRIALCGYENGTNSHADGPRCRGRRTAATNLRERSRGGHSVNSYRERIWFQPALHQGVERVSTDLLGARSTSAGTSGRRQRHPERRDGGQSPRVNAIRPLAASRDPSARGSLRRLGLLLRQYPSTGPGRRQRGPPAARLPVHGPLRRLLGRVLRPAIGLGQCDHIVRGMLRAYRRNPLRAYICDLINAPRCVARETDAILLADSPVESSGLARNAVVRHDELVAKVVELTLATHVGHCPFAPHTMPAADRPGRIVRIIVARRVPGFKPNTSRVKTLSVRCDRLSVYNRRAWRGGDRTAGVRDLD